MEKYVGKSVFSGTAIGRILFYSKGQQQVKCEKVDELSVSPAFILPVRKAIREACYKYNKTGKS